MAKIELCFGLFWAKKSGPKSAENCEGAGKNEQLARYCSLKVGHLIPFDQAQHDPAPTK